jgi:hypothetical protein
MAPLPQLLAWLRTKTEPLKNVTLMRKDARSISLTDATHVYMYLMPNMMEILYPKLLEELRPGTRLISCDFTFKHKKPVSVVEVKDHKLYLYDF